MSKTKKHTRLIRDILNNKPWRAVQALVDSLPYHAERPDFRISMFTFGSSCSDICYGCAATCTIQEVAKLDLQPNEIESATSRAKALRFDRKDLIEFEDAIEELRTSSLYSLFGYFGFNSEESKCLHAKYGRDLRHLDNRTWSRHLPKYQDLADKLKADRVYVR